MLADTDTPVIHESRQVASQAETDANLAKWAAVSKFQAAQQEAAAVEQRIAEEILERQAEIDAGQS